MLSPVGLEERQLKLNRQVSRKLRAPQLGEAMDVIISVLPILLIGSLFVVMVYAAKLYRDGRKSTVMATALALVGIFWLVAQFWGGLKFHNLDAIIVSLAQIVPSVIFILMAWKLLRGKR